MDHDQELLDINDNIDLDNDLLASTGDGLSDDEDLVLPPTEIDPVVSATAKPHSAVIHCIFSARFDEGEGPVIEWKYPPDADLEGVEFNVLASGLHNRSGPDIIYFKKSEYYGIGCYKRHLVNNRGSRDAVMRSIGVIMEHYGYLYKHTPFLIRLATEQSGQRLTETVIADMTQYWKKHQADALETVHAPSPSLSFNLPSDAFTDLFGLLGEKIFSLWKAAMLRKKILFVLDPPLRALCLYVYASIFLVRHQVKAAQRRVFEPKPLFYVNITQTHYLLEQTDYLACTTERIFEGKKHLYDVLITTDPDKDPEESVEITAHDSDLHETIKCTVGDRLKHMYLLKKFQAQDQNMLLSFFQDMNNKLLNGIITARQRQSPIGPEEMPMFGLHASDFRFFTAMLDFLGVDIVLKTPFCGCCY